MRLRIHLIHNFFEYWAEIYRRGGSKCAFAHTSHMFICIYYEYWIHIYEGNPSALSYTSHMCINICFEYWAEIYRKGDLRAPSCIHLISV